MLRASQLVAWLKLEKVLKTPLGVREPYTCEDAKKDVDFFFSKKRGREKQMALNRSLLGHITAGSTMGKHNIACQKCWDYYQQMKRDHCGG